VNIIIEGSYGAILENHAKWFHANAPETHDIGMGHVALFKRDNIPTFFNIEKIVALDDGDGVPHKKNLRPKLVEYVC